MQREVYGKISPSLLIVLPNCSFRMIILNSYRLYDKRAPIEAQYPSPRPSASQEYVQDDRKDRERNILLHAPPG